MTVSKSITMVLPPGLLLMIVGGGCSNAEPPSGPGPPPLFTQGPPRMMLKGMPMSSLIELPSGTPVRALFIGNSLTGAHELPRMVQAMGASVGIRLEFNACMRGGSNLEDHWNDQRCRALLDEGSWNYVVLQQGPSTLPESRVDLKLWTEKWAVEVRSRKARPALYMVWAPRGQANGMERASASYTAAARASDCLLFPAGDAWARARKSAADIELYERDGLHPSLAGTYLAALVITRGLIGQQAERIPNQFEIATGTNLDLPPSTCARLKRIAWNSKTHAP